MRFVDAADLDRYVAADQALPADARLLRGVGEGELLPRAALGTADEAGVLQLPIAVEPTLVPDGVGAGSVVERLRPRHRRGAPSAPAPPSTGSPSSTRPSADDLTGARQLVLAVEPGRRRSLVRAARRSRGARGHGRRELSGGRRPGAGGRRRTGSPRRSPGWPTGATSSCSSAASTSPTCSPPRPPARPRWRSSRSTRPVSTGPRSTTCAATASARWRCCPAGPTSTRPPCRATRIGVRALVGDDELDRARRPRRRRRRARPHRRPRRRRGPTPAPVRQPGPGRGGLGTGRCPRAYDARGRPRRRARPRPPHDPGRRRPLRRRGRPAARHRRRGLGAAGRDPAGRHRPAARAVRLGCSGRSTTGSASSPDCRAPTAGSRSAPGSSTTCSTWRRSHGHVVVDTGFSLEHDPATDAGRGRAQHDDPGGARRPPTRWSSSAAPTRSGSSRLARGLVELRETTGRTDVRVVVNRMRPTLGWAEQDIAGMLGGLVHVTGLHFLPDDRAAVDRALVAGRSLHRGRRLRRRPGASTVSPRRWCRRPLRRRTAGRARRR